MTGQTGSGFGERGFIAHTARGLKLKKLSSEGPDCKRSALGGGRPLKEPEAGPKGGKRGLRGKKGLNIQEINHFLHYLSEHLFTLPLGCKMWTWQKCLCTSMPML